jgi:hypothetical protein
MTAGEWVALTIGIAGVIAALSAFATTKRRRSLIGICVMLMIIALTIGTISTMVRLGRSPGGATAQPVSPQHASPESARSESPSRPSVTTSTTPTPTQPLIRRQSGGNPIRLSLDTEVDLDSMEPNWNVSRFPYGGSGSDLYYSWNGRVEQTRSTYYPVIGEASYAICQAATAQVRSIDLNDRGNATEFCLLTSEGRLAFVRVVDVHDPVAFDVIVWEKS